jgi:prolipoprotein diacylglyceryl transferase
VWYLGPVPIRAYALFIIAGIIVALVLGDRRWAARGGERGVIYDIALWAVPFGLIGGRLYHVITDWPKYFGEGGAGLLGVVRIWDGGLGIWGAVALGGVGAWIGCRSRGIPLPAFGDAIAPGIVLAQAIGRLGNYFNQELYGRPTDLPWGLEIYERVGANGVVSPDLANGVSTGQVYAVVHPTFLYELLWNVLVFAVLIWIDRRFKIGHGRLFAMYVAGYCVGRFWIELLRSDHASLIADIRVNSFTSTFVFIGAVVYIMVAPKGREDPETLKGKSRDGSLIDEVADELVAVAATSGVVAAAKAAGDDEDEDIGADAEKHVDESEEPEDDPGVGTDSAAVVELLEAAAAEEAVADESGGDEAESDEGADEAEQVAAEVAAEDDEAESGEADAEEAADAEEPEADEPSGDEAEAEAVGGVGAVEGEDAVEAQEAAPEVHEAAVEGANEAEQTAADVAAEDDEAESGEADAEEPEADEPSVEESETEESGEDKSAEGEAEAVGGVGAVEGEDAVEAHEAAPEVHEAAVDGADEAEQVAAEVAAEDAEVDEPGEEERSIEDVTEGEGEVAPEPEEADAEADDLSAEDSEPGESGGDEPAEVITEEEAESVGGVGVAEGEGDEESEPDRPAEDEDSTEDVVEDEADEGDAESESNADGEGSGTEDPVEQPRTEAPVAQAEERGGRLRRMFRRRNR